MRRVIVAIATAIILAGASTASQARNDTAGVEYFTQDGHAYHKGGHRRVCRDVYKTKVVWKNHKKFVKRVKVGRRCY
jgi:hypothetical protein